MIDFLLINRGVTPSTGLCALTHCDTRQYHFISTNLAWSEAQTYCRERYTDLATVDGIEEQNRVMNTAQSTSGGYTQKAWIGLYRNGGGTFLWSDKSSTAYRNWREGQPDNSGGNEECAATHLGNAGVWSDEQCSTKLDFVCYGDEKSE